MKWPSWDDVWIFLGLKKKKDEKPKPPKPEPEDELWPEDDNGFLWKPGGEHSGNLVVLFPSSMPYKDVKKKWKFKEGTKFIVDAYVAKDREANNVVKELGMRKTHISEPEEDVTDRINPNGNRPHARAGSHGGAYGNDIYAVAKWETIDGSVKGFWSRHIPEGAGRWEGHRDPLKRTG